MRKLIPWKNRNTQVKLDDILNQIGQADDLEINEIIQAVIHRYNTVFPDWEVIFLSLPLQSKEREQLIEQSIEQLRRP